MPLNSVKYIILAVLLSSSPAQARYVPGPVSFPLKLRVTDDGIPELRNQWDYSINSLLDTAGSDIWKKRFMGGTDILRRDTLEFLLYCVSLRPYIL